MISSFKICKLTSATFLVDGKWTLYPKYIFKCFALCHSDHCPLLSSASFSEHFGISLYTPQYGASTIKKKLLSDFLTNIIYVLQPLQRTESSARSRKLIIGSAA